MQGYGHWISRGVVFQQYLVADREAHIEAGPLMMTLALRSKDHVESELCMELQAE